MEIDINAMLYRQIKDGKQYDKLFPKSQCKSTFLGTGMTDFSVNAMADLVKKYAGQTEKVAQVLKQRSLQATCNAIHEFAYGHFQYKADKEDQLLRSPACSWYSRYEGIDCKSYSIIASCILTNLKINHHIRRIKQPGLSPNHYTHVYVIVPVDQKTGKLTTGYYTIDGTLADSTEPLFTEKSDTYMSMQHFGLNAPAPLHKVYEAEVIGYAPDLNRPFLREVDIVHLPGLGGISLTTIKNQIFSAGWHPSCINGSLNMNHFNATLATVVPAFDAMFADVNTALKNGDPTLLAKINKIFVVSTQILSHSFLKANGGWDSKCSKDSVNAYKGLGMYYHALVHSGFIGWIKHYFDITETIAKFPNNTFDIAIAFDKGSDDAIIDIVQISSIKPKATTTDIKPFLLTPYAVDKANLSPTAFNIGQFLSGISDVIVSIKGGTPNSGGGYGGGSGSGSGSGTYEGADGGGTGNNVKTAGLGIGGFLILAAGAGIIFSGMKDKPATKTATSVATRRKATTKK